LLMHGVTMKYIVDARCNHEIYCWCTV